jgi:transposase InsO family protein
VTRTRDRRRIWWIVISPPWARTNSGSPTITFVPTASGFLYLAVVLDAWSRKIVGWSMANHLRTELVLDALEMAIGNAVLAMSSITRIKEANTRL